MIIDFDKMRKNGINRISIGLQSADDRELKILGRLHNVRQAEQCIERAKNAGFENISLDLMTATPLQTMESLERSIEFCAEKEVQHISAYILKIEQGTPYYPMREKLGICGEEEQAEILEMMQNRSCGKLVQVPCCKVCTEDEYEHLKKDAAKSLQM